MKIKKKLIFLSALFCFMIILLPLAGCSFGVKEKGFNVYFSSDSTLVEEGNDTISVEYGQFTNIEDYIVVKKITDAFSSCLSVWAH